MLSRNPQVSRAEATAAIPLILARVAEINALPGRPVAIKRVALWGSYLSNRDPIGDLDIAVQLEMDQAGLTTIAAFDAAEKLLATVLLHLEATSFVHVSSWNFVLEFSAPWTEIFPVWQRMHHG